MHGDGGTEARRPGGGAECTRRVVVHGEGIRMGGSGDLENEGRAYEPTMGKIYLRCEFTVSANAQRSGTWDSNANSSALLEV